AGPDRGRCGLRRAGSLLRRTGRPRPERGTCPDLPHPRLRDQLLQSPGGVPQLHLRRGHRRARGPARGSPGHHRIRRSVPADVGPHDGPGTPRAGQPHHGAAAHLHGPGAGAGAQGRFMSMSVRESVEVGAFRLGWTAVRKLPAPVAYRLFDRIAARMVRRNGKGVQRMRANYARVRPELGTAALEELVHAGVRSYMRYWCDSFRLPDRTAQELAAKVRVVGDGPPRQALGAGQGVVAFLGHLGNWDTVGAWATYHLAPVTTVAERLRPEALFDQFVAYREALGMTILPLTRDKPPFPTLVRTVPAGGLVPLR